MEWFSGNIPQAIQLAKERGSIFLVYVTGEDEDTKGMDKMWEDAEVSEMCKRDATVAIKIQGNSESCTFFSQIYPVVIIPSAYFIGNNGTPLEVIGGKVDADSFRQKVQNVLERNKSNEASPAQSSQQQHMSSAASSSAASQLPGTSAASSSRSDVAMAATSEEEEPQKKKSKPELDDRVERARELLEKKKALKAQEEFEKERLKEVERRKTGQSVQQLKQFQQEREILEVKEQLKKEKEEERKAREHIKLEIARDRAERNAKYQTEKSQKTEQQEAARKAKLVEQQRAAAEAGARRSETARIQFRLPDGSSVSNQFPSSERLQAAYEFVVQRMDCDVTLSTAYPRRTFTQSDMDATFVDLQLAPTAVLIVVPASGSLGNSSGGGGGGLLSLLFAPFMVIWNLIMSFFAPSPALTQNSNSSAGSSSSTSAAGGDRERQSATKRSRQEGNIRRMRNPDDDDDENATWNGNSTQQM
ncbi:UBX domain-containing protein 4-like [Littorina saxatilis]|uniref:UBX domain-containing protein 4 n=1 Tax=Littorina saxatilis TaxID=31220 RepID=A0AAN9AT98_9CAEN